MKLDKEQKQRAIDELSQPYGRVELECDGFLITLFVQRTKTLTYRVITYVNGYIKTDWLLPENAAPESRFLRKSVRQNVSAAKRKDVEKQMGKRWVKNHPYYSGSITLFYPDWPNGKNAINHLCKVSESIKIL